MEILKEWDFPAGGVMQLVEDKERAGHSSVTFMVEDIREVENWLKTKGIDHDGT